MASIPGYRGAVGEIQTRILLFFMSCICSVFSMKRLSLLLLAAFLFQPIDVRAQPRRPGAPNLGEVETKWLGIMFAISRLERIQDNRLLVFVRVATSPSARKGTFLGSESSDSSGASEAENPDRKPFSLASAIMTDDQTRERYPVLRLSLRRAKRIFLANSSAVCTLVRVRR